METPHFRGASYGGPALNRSVTWVHVVHGRRNPKRLGFDEVNPIVINTNKPTFWGMVYTTHKFMAILGMVYGFGVCQILILSTVLFGSAHIVWSQRCVNHPGGVVLERVYIPTYSNFMKVTHGCGDTN